MSPPPDSESKSKTTSEPREEQRGLSLSSHGALPPGRYHADASAFGPALDLNTAPWGGCPIWAEEDAYFPSPSNTGNAHSGTAFESWNFPPAAAALQFTQPYNEPTPPIIPNEYNGLEQFDFYGNVNPSAFTPFGPCFDIPGPLGPFQETIQPYGHNSTMEPILPVGPTLSQTIVPPSQATEGRIACREEGCHKTFRRESDYRRHMADSHGPVRFQCVIVGCDKTFGRRDKLNDHLRQGHKTDIEVKQVRRRRGATRLN